MLSEDRKVEIIDYILQYGFRCAGNRKLYSRYYPLEGDSCSAPLYSAYVKGVFVLLCEEDTAIFATSLVDIKPLSENIPPREWDRIMGRFK